MPIIEVEFVVDEVLGSRLDHSETVGRIASRIANEAATIFDAPANQVWVKLRTLPSYRYAENGGRIWPL